MLGRLGMLVTLAGCAFEPTGIAFDSGQETDSAPDADGMEVDGAPPDVQGCWSLSFDGDSWVDVPFAAPYDQVNAFSMGAWAKLAGGTPAGGEYHIASHHNHGLNQGYVLMFKGGIPELRVYHPDGTQCECKPDPIGTPLDMIVPGQWHHIAGSFDSGTALLFLDGRLSRTCLNLDTYANCYDATAAAYTGPFWIGAASNDGGSFAWNGSIKDVFVDDSPLGAADDPRVHVACDGAGDAFFGMTEGTGGTTASACETASVGALDGFASSIPTWTADCPP